MRTIMAPTILRQDSRGVWYLMNRALRGWAEFAFGPYWSLEDVRAEWNVTIGGAGQDAFSTYRHVSPADVLSTYRDASPA